jgi:hypothetical protein
MEAGGTRYIAYCSRKSQIRVYNFADLHVNAEACAIDKIKEDIDRVRLDDSAFWFGGGDYADCISHMDKRFHPDSVAKDVRVKDLGNIGKVSMEKVRDLFKPIRHKCMGLLYGNHELEYMKAKEQTDLHGWLCQELGVQNLGYCAFVDVVFVRSSEYKHPALLHSCKVSNSRWEVRFFLHHGAGLATTPGGKLNKLIHFMNYFDADVYMIGHVHDQVGRRQEMMTADKCCKQITSKVKLGVISGSYLRTYSSGTTTYGEQRAYMPTTLGAARVTIVPDKRELLGEI